MGKYHKRYLSVTKEEYERAHDILDKFYDRGDIDSITVTVRAKDEDILIGLTCSTDDYSSIAKELGINVL